MEEIKTGQYPLEILNKPISYDKPKDIIILNEENAVKNESISLNESPIDNLENSILVENDVQESQDIFDITCSISSNTGEEIITSFSYDDNGNLIKLTRTQNNNTDITLYRYNELNQLIEYKNPQGIATTYTYYANGLRKTKTTGDETTTFYLDDKNVIIETKNGQLSARNIWGINPISRENENGNSLYYLYNGHADVVAMTDEESNVVNTYDYDVYGVLKEADEKGMNNPVRYAGEYYDEDSGLYYLRSRYYDPGLMRFINEDTYKGDVKDPLSLNLYTYCKGNPISYTDPSGHLVWWIPAVIGGIAGGIYSYVKTGKVQLSYVAQDSILGMCIYGIGTAAYGTYKFYRMSNTTDTAEIAATEGAGKATRDTLLESVTNQKLKNAIDQIYRPDAKTGNGGLADAIRHELSTGELVGGKSHIIKGNERVKNLENIIKSQNLNSTDMQIAQELLNDLKNALGGK